MNFFDKPVENDRGLRVCFSVEPDRAGGVQTGSGHCTTTNHGGHAFATFAASGRYCGRVTITVTEAGEGRGSSRHTVVMVDCDHHVLAAAAVPATPMGGSGLALGGAALALLAGVGLRARRFVVSWRRPNTLPA